MSGGDLLAMITRLGFVQMDSIRTLERAHHMILFSRNQTYRPDMLKKLTEDDRALFENWTHDAAVIPAEFFPCWRAAMAQNAPDLARRWTKWGREGFQKQAGEVLAEVAKRGPCLAREMGREEERSSGGWWEWNPSKSALEWLWRSGRLCVTRREGFQKVYDLTENVIPARFRAETLSREDLVNWACAGALERLGFATTGEIAAFWALVTPAEAKAWAEAQNNLIEIAIECADGSLRRCLARPDILEEEPPEPPARIRALSPFDPLIRDRKRAERLFGFHYRIEVFVPEPKRRWGYYVFPLLEGAHFAGRIDMKADRAADRLTVTAFWPEKGVRMGAGRLARLEAEIERQRRFAGVAEAGFQDGWLREWRDDAD